MVHKIKIISISSFIMILSVKTNLQAQELVLDLWDGNIPGAISNDDYHEIVSDKGGWIRISKVVDPTITVYLPENKSSKVPAVLICPGGGYARLAYDHEGKEVAEWLNKQGIAGILLKYRLPSDEIMENKTIGPLQDAQRAIRLIREHAGEWNIDPAKVGVMGFSAGGHLAASLTTLYDMPVYKNTGEWSARPDFSILVYGVISMQDSLTHKGSQINLLGQDPSRELIDQFSNELHVDNNTPPCFLIPSSDDNAVNYMNSMLFYEALVKNGVKAELHVYDNGGHGYGLATRKAGPKKWPDNLSYWLFKVTSGEE
jgi:acetyl esterase/lipase